MLEYFDSRFGRGRCAAYAGEKSPRNPCKVYAMRATATIQVENDRVIVTEWRFAPGAGTGYHVHGHDYVVVPLTSGTLRLEDAEGTREASLTAGVCYARSAGIAHNVVNANEFEFRFVEIELK